MKIWKKMALGSTAVLAALSLAACSNGSSNSSSSSSNSNKKANLTLWECVNLALPSYTL